MKNNDCNPTWHRAVRSAGASRLPMRFWPIPKMRAPITTLLVLTAACSFGATFSGLGDLAGGIFESGAYDVSADGSVVVGFSRSTSGVEAFRWTQQSGIVGLGDLTGGTFDSFAFGVSGDGLTIVGSGVGNSGQEAFRWTSGTGMIGLGDLAGGSFQSVAYGTSFDGTTIVGLGVTTAGVGEIGARAVRWQSGGSPIALGSTDNTYASAVSGDGLTIVGRQGNEAFRWTLITGMVGLGYLPGGYPSSYAYAISADGSAIVGQGVHANSSESEAFLWTSATGIVGLGDLPGGGFYSYAWDVSGDGSVVVGTGRTASGEEAFIWDSARGMRNLREVLISDYGVTNLTGWTLTTARAISADGHTIVGDGINPSGQMEAWRVTGIPDPSFPTVTTDAASSVTANGARLNGMVNPRGRVTTAQFEYGLTTAYGGTASVTLSPNNGTSAQAVSAEITGLTPNTLYHYRLAATNSEGTNNGTDQTFTTLTDTDGDGIADIFETGTGIYVSPTNTGTNPANSDSDGDGLKDGQEVNTYATNPNVTDSDGDGFDDGFEVNTGFNPASAASTPDALSSIRTAVEYRFNAALGVSYRIEASTDLLDWSTIETPIIGTGGVVTRFYSIEAQPKRFFRSRRN